MPDKKYLARIHIMKKEKGIPEEDYRRVLSSEFGVRSSKDLDNQKALRLIRRLRDFRKDAYSSSAEQVWLLKDLWHQVYRGNREESDLNLFLFRHFKISHINFLDGHTAYQATEAIKAMAARRGIVLERTRGREDTEMRRKNHAAL
jgi:hypothetical protein